MKELSIFIDESGDFGKYDYRCPYYIIAMVMHDQSHDITAELEKLERELDYIGYPNHCIHAGPIIRQEQEYRFESLEVRQKIMKKMMSFLRQIDIKYKTIYIEKKHISDDVEATGKLSKQLRKVIPSDYRLFQIADLICTLQLLELKCDNRVLSHSEKLFFENDRTLKKNYFKPLKQKML